MAGGRLWLMGAVGLAVAVLLHRGAEILTPSADTTALRRGFEIYQNVCASCHGLAQVHFRDLTAIGLTDAQIAAIAAHAQMPDGTDEVGQPVLRPGRADDRFPSPFPNDKVARAVNGGVVPPDQSDLAKARAGGAAYIHDLLEGYRSPPTGTPEVPGRSYNTVFPGHWIAMPQPLFEGQFPGADGAPASLDQETRDIAAFLSFVADPQAVQRRRMGVGVVSFLVILAGVTYAISRRIWAPLSAPPDKT